MPILNPRELLSRKPAKLGAPVSLQLGGRGIRSIERIGAHYLIVAGPPADSGDFALYRWSGKADQAPQRVETDLGALRPEALFQIPQTHRGQLLSDDGGIHVDGVECKQLPREQRSFRSLTLDLPP